MSVKNQLRKTLSKHNHHYFSKIKWNIIDGLGHFDYSQYYSKISAHNKKKFNNLSYRWFRRFSI